MKEASTHIETDLDTHTRELLIIIFIAGEVFELTYDALTLPAKAMVKEQLRRALADADGQADMPF